MFPRPHGPLPRSRCCAQERSPRAPLMGCGGRARSGRTSSSAFRGRARSNSEDGGSKGRRESQVGQDVLFCLSGSGAVELGSRRIEVQAGEVVWIANEAPHAHIADARDPWTLLWFRFDGPNPAAVRMRLFGEGVPRVAASDRAGLVAWFKRLFLVLRRRDRSLDFHLNQLVSEFFLLMARSLAAPASRDASDPLPACRPR